MSSTPRRSYHSGDTSKTSGRSLSADSRSALKRGNQKDGRAHDGEHQRCSGPQNSRRQCVSRRCLRGIHGRDRYLVAEVASHRPNRYDADCNRGKTERALLHAAHGRFRVRLGRVLVWEPPGHLVLAWQVTHGWAHQPDLSKCSEIEVHFLSLGRETTRVELEHRFFDRAGIGGDAMRAAVDAPNGWNKVLGQYSDHITTSHGGQLA